MRTKAIVLVHYICTQPNLHMQTFALYSRCILKPPCSLSTESGLLPRQKRRHAGGTTNKVTLAVYYKLTEVVENLALLIETQPLTDTTVLQVHLVDRKWVWSQGVLFFTGVLSGDISLLCGECQHLAAQRPKTCQSCKSASLWSEYCSAFVILYFIALPFFQFTCCFSDFLSLREAQGPDP